MKALLTYIPVMVFSTKVLELHTVQEKSCFFLLRAPLIDDIMDYPRVYYGLILSVGYAFNIT